jgi:hypothetical protein
MLRRVRIVPPPRPLFKPSRTGWKQMKLKEMSALRMEPVMTADSRRRHVETRPGLRAAALGLACVVGVFAILGLLYSLG